jgi:hypothetical protein
VLGLTQHEPRVGEALGEGEDAPAHDGVDQREDRGSKARLPVEAVEVLLRHPVHRAVHAAQGDGDASRHVLDGTRVGEPGNEGPLAYLRR